MKQTGQFERDYQDALDSLRFSGQGKGRIMKSLMEQQETKPARRRSIRPLRAGLIAACLCLALAGTAFAAATIYRLTVQLIQNEEYSGYSVSGASRVKYPLSSFSPELIAASEGREGPFDPVSRTFDTWDEVRAFIGEDIPCVCPSGWVGNYDVVLFHRQYELDQTDPDGELTGITIFTLGPKYTLGPTGLLTIGIYTENILDADHAGALYNNPRYNMEQLDSYLMSNGATAEIVLQSAEGEKGCICYGIFVKDGISYQLDVYGASRELAQTRIKMVLDCFP